MAIERNEGRKRILLWHWGRRGGGPRYTYELARAMAGRVDLHVSYSRQSELADQMAGLGLPALVVDTYQGPLEAAFATLRLPWLRRRFAGYLRRHRIDTVICTMGHLWNMAVAPVVAAAGARYCLTLHDAILHVGEENRVRTWALGRELHHVDGIVTLSRHVQDQLVAKYRYERERTWVLPHGVFTFGEARLRSHPSPDRPFHLLFFGRILPYKGIDLLLDAYARLRERFGARVVLTLAGAGDLGPYAGALAGLPGVTVDNRWFREDEIPALLHPADLVVLPYREASQSGVVASAYGVGLPVVVTPVGGLIEQVVDRRTGRLAARVSGEAVADAVAELITDAALYRACSAGALHQIETELAWNVIADGFLAVADRLAARAETLPAAAACAKPTPTTGRS